ncbi:TraB/GumN family protein [Novosphingobium colocasiae]
MAQPGTVFVAVGAGHLGGPDSVQTQLARLHIRVSRVQ